VLRLRHRPVSAEGCRFPHRARKKGNTKNGTGEIDAASRALEGSSFEAMATRWADREEQVRATVHDRDAKVSKIKERIGWGIGGCFDQNHVMIGFRNAWKKHAKIVIKGTRQAIVLKGRIELEVRIRFYRILKMDASLDGRRAEWRQMVEHFTGKGVRELTNLTRLRFGSSACSSRRRLTCSTRSKRAPPRSSSSAWRR
jgi:hypothetical protein